MYRWIVFLHILSVFTFLLAQGASAAVMFRLRSERDVDRIRALLDVPDVSSRVMNVSLALLLITGIIAAFMGAWWGRGWIWLSLVLFVAIRVVMSFFGRLYFERVWNVVKPKTDEDKKVGRCADPLNTQQLDAALHSGRPLLLTVIGVGGLVVILWLMMFKPF